MPTTNESMVILMADDDPDDRLMAQEALEEAHLRNELRFVGDGEELLAYLRRQGRYEDPALSPTPGLVLLDLNMPRMDGREALAQIKADPELRCIPVVALTTSEADADILRTYELGVSSFIPKPVSFEGLVEVMQALGEYWFQIVRRPPVTR